MSNESYVIQGKTVEIPCVVRDAAAGTAMFMVPASAAAPLIPDAFELIESEPGQTQISLLAVDYRDNDLGDYNEVGIVFFVKPRGSSADKAGTYIYQLPVNQSFTSEAGCTIWGFPKSVQEIDIDYTEKSATCRLVMDGEHVLTLSLPRGGTGESADSESTGYTILNGKPHTNSFTRGGAGEETTLGGEGVTLELGTHPIADTLRQLGLPKEALLSNWCEHMRGSFGPSVPL